AVAGDAGALGRLLAARRTDGVAWFTRPAGGGDAGLAAATRLLGLVQALARLPLPRPRLVIVTGGATGDTARPDEAALWGLGRVAATEFPDLDVALVDCGEDERVPLWLARELAGDTPEREIRLATDGRSGCRVVAWTP